MKKLALSQWVKMVEHYQNEDRDAVIVRVDEEDPDSMVEVQLSVIKAGTPGRYKLVDAEGKSICQTVITASGERAGRNANPNAVAATSLARDREALTNSWDRLTSHLTDLHKDQSATIKAQAAEIAQLKEELAIAKVEAADGEDNNEWSELIKVAGGLLGQKGFKKYLQTLVDRVAPQLSPECMQELLPVLNKEFSGMMAGGFDFAGMLTEGGSSED